MTGLLKDTRITVRISEADLLWLAQESDRRGITLGELIRTLIDKLRRANAGH
jgi:predicted DNA binding CopG/RHH family protein